MKEDAPAPERIPKKRRQLEAAPRLWVAQWLARDDITPSERRRLEEEKARRKHAVADNKVGVLVGEEGMTPEQLGAFRDVLPSVGATEVHHPGVASRVHGTCKALGVPVCVHDGFDGASEVVKGSDMIVAAPKDSRSSRGNKLDVWALIKYARHRKLPVKIIMPDGRVDEEGDHGG